MKGTAGRVGGGGSGLAPGEELRESAQPGSAAVPPATASALAAELLRRAEEDRHLTRRAQADPTPLRKHRIAQCHRDNAQALAAIVDRHGWPHADLVGTDASTAALMILLHAPHLGFRLRCRDLIAHATADGHTPAIHLAYIADQCAVDLGQPQYYGTRINPSTLRPYPIRRPQSVDERRGDVGLGPLQEQLRALRITG
ncbi:DUF6624 domain-containing protein [Streptomyces sediminimaris]|uniref:DUF6624 domain-containing protein n=1 Tax=Streptomyces sediminimaris TaxID=3383721 RepID=UPI00399B4B74